MDTQLVNQHQLRLGCDCAPSEDGSESIGVSRKTGHCFTGPEYTRRRRVQGHNGIGRYIYPCGSASQGRRVAHFFASLYFGFLLSRPNQIVCYLYSLVGLLS